MSGGFVSVPVVVSAEDMERASGSFYLLADLARLNPYRLPLQEAPGHYAERRDCAFCGAVRGFDHDPLCVWQRAKERADALAAEGDAR